MNITDDNPLSLFSMLPTGKGQRNDSNDIDCLDHWTWIGGVRRPFNNSVCIILAIIKNFTKRSIRV